VTIWDLGLRILDLEEKGFFLSLKATNIKAQGKRVK